jgi:hypothetical protein
LLKEIHFAFTKIAPMRHIKLLDSTKPPPVISIHEPLNAGPFVGHNAEVVIVGVYVNTSMERVKLCSSNATSNATAPVVALPDDRGGVMHVIVSADVRTPAMCDAPKRQIGAGIFDTSTSKYPRIMTTVPPTLGPVAGESMLRIGEAT